MLTGVVHDDLYSNQLDDVISDMVKIDGAANCKKDPLLSLKAPKKHTHTFY